MPRFLFIGNRPPGRRQHAAATRPRAALSRAAWSAHHINAQFSNKWSEAASDLTQLKKILCMPRVEGDQTLRTRRAATI